MLNIIKVLQVGTEDWKERYVLPKDVQITFMDEVTKEQKTEFDIVFVERRLTYKEIQLLLPQTRTYALYFIEGIELTENMQKFFACKKGKWLKKEDILHFLKEEARNYFPKPYGEKFKHNNFSVAQGFKGQVMYDGFYSVTMTGQFGDELSQIGYWRNNIPVFQGQAIDLWLEYETKGEVEVALCVTQFVSGTLSDIQQKWVFSQKELDQVVTVDNQMKTGQVFVSLMAKGEGTLKMVALHDRYSRRGHGTFLPGGERYVTKKREEIFYYFDPGDMKPPLNVYFSGYKTLQGFEGHNMMKKMGAPYLLIAEPRLEGGGFYMGDKEYETAMVDIVKKHMLELGFTREQLILSGLSMGTFGALYYGCDLLPHAMILGKPLASIGDVAANERLHRPGGFPTSLDVLKYQTGGMENSNVQQLNDRLWNKFDASDWRKSKFVVSYMIEDDYDGTGYEMLISHLKSAGVQVYGKGIHGRHNDATGAIAGWFKSQYDKILREDFSRRIEK